jgi:hypothetical protein
MVCKQLASSGMLMGKKTVAFGAGNKDHLLLCGKCTQNE